MVRYFFLNEMITKDQSKHMHYLLQLAQNNTTQFLLCNEVEEMKPLMLEDTLDVCKVSHGFHMPIITLDIEMTNGQVLIGLFFVHIATHTLILFDADLDNEFLERLFSEYYDFQNFCCLSGTASSNNPKFTYLKGNTNSYFTLRSDLTNGEKGVNPIISAQPLILTFNGAKYDIPHVVFFKVRFPIFSCASEFKREFIFKFDPKTKNFGYMEDV